MRQAFLLFLLNITATICFSQSDVTLRDGSRVKMSADGYQTHYNIDGNKLDEGQISKQGKVGKWQYYAATTGNKYAEVNFLKDKLSGPAIYYDSVNKHVYSEGRYLDGLKDGLWKFYYSENGVLKGTETYSKGMLSGLAKYYNLSGTGQPFLTSEGSYDNNARHGTWKFYSKTEGKLYAQIDFKKGAGDGSAVYYDTITGHKTGEGIHSNNKRFGKWMFYAHITGKLHGIENYKDGLMEGPTQYYDTVGEYIEDVIEAKGQYEKNLREGVWTFYYPSGNIRAEESYRDSILNGLAIYYYDCEDKRILTKGIMKNNREKGVWSDYDSLTKFKSSEVNYDDSLDMGELTFFFDDNRAQPSRIHENEDDLKNGWVKMYDSLSGNLRTILVFENGEMTGKIGYDIDNGRKVDSMIFFKNVEKYQWVICKYDSVCINNNLIQEIREVDSVNERIHTRFYFHCTDKRLMQEVFRDGDVDSCIYYDSLSGVRYASCIYVGGNKNGQAYEYYSDGITLKRKLLYKDDIAEGSVQYYDSATENIVIEGVFSNGKRVGTWVCYHPQNGKVAYKEKYKNGYIDGDVELFDTSGRVISLISFNNGVKSGKWVYYHVGTTNTWIEMNYNKDSLDGTIKTYYPSGETKRVEKYKNGTQEEAICYSKSGDIIEYHPLISQATFQDDVMTYIGNNLRYPEKAQKDKVEGKVKVRFTLNEVGKVTDVAVLEGLSPECDEEAVRLISSMPLWSPFEVDGVPMKTYKTLPVVFWLRD
ncbi:MAG: TonB family protein [Chitinophagales bacterium]|nr:TonB family protein [Chitinophagaceae bacterium]MCB9064313.1 TonB family protein [Chitinophagales bacterium]